MMFAGLLIIIAVLCFFLSDHDYKGILKQESAKAILKRRYAEGEIGLEEYNEKMKVIEQAR